MTAVEDRPDDKGTRVPRTDFGRRFDMAFGAARELIRIRFAEDGCVVGIGEVLEHLDDRFGDAAGITGDFTAVLSLSMELWADPHIDQVDDGFIDFCWKEAASARSGRPGSCDAALTATPPHSTVRAGGHGGPGGFPAASHVRHARDVASLQYVLAELAHTRRLDFEAHERLQWNHCLPMWETLYRGTTCAVRDESTWDGAWDWYDNAYSDGRQVMVQARMKNWMELERDWPYNAGMCGDSPIQEHPWGSLCQIFPVVDPYNGYCDYPSMEIDLEGVIEQLGPPPTGLGTEAESGVGGQ